MRWPAFALAVLLVPVATAGNLFSDPTCVDDTCVTPTLCVEGVACFDNTCGRALTCEGELRLADECNVNATISGETCEASTTLGLGVKRGDAQTFSSGAGLILTNGGVQGQDLPNTWTSDSAEVRLEVLDADLGTLTLTFYRSTITHEVGTVEQYGVGAGHTGSNVTPTPIMVVAALVLVDGNPQTCFVRSEPAADVATECPGLNPLA